MRAAVVVALAVSVVAVAADQKPALLEAVEVTINGKNDEWTATGLTVEKGDLVLVEASGKVKVGEWTGETSPDGVGAKGLGRLMMKIGEEGGISAGARFFYTVGEKPLGAVKLRVHDTKHDDNDGAYVVRVVRIPAAAIPAVKK